MGRLRDGYEAPLWQGISEEVVDLYGDDCTILYRFSSAEGNMTGKDPLYGESRTSTKYVPYKIKSLFLEWRNEYEALEQGAHDTLSNLIFVSLKHLQKGFVPQDEKQEFVDHGDLIEILRKGESFIYDILEYQRIGYLNNSDQFTGYELTVKRSDKFVPERKELLQGLGI